MKSYAQTEENRNALKMNVKMFRIIKGIELLAKDGTKVGISCERNKLLDEKVIFIFKMCFFGGDLLVLREKLCTFAAKVKILTPYSRPI